ENPVPGFPSTVLSPPWQTLDEWQPVHEGDLGHSSTRSGNRFPSATRRQPDLLPAHRKQRSAPPGVGTLSPSDTRPATLPGGKNRTVPLHEDCCDPRPVDIASSHCCLPR